MFFFCTNESGLGDEVSDGDGNLLDDVFTHHLDVVLQLGGDGNDGGALGNRSCRREEKVWSLNSQDSCSGIIVYRNAIITSFGELKMMSSVSAENKPVSWSGLFRELFYR